MIAILKEINQTLKEILSELKQQKESTAVTIDSNKLSFTSSEVVQNSEGININHK